MKCYSKMAETSNHSNHNIPNNNYIPNNGNTVDDDASDAGSVIDNPLPVTADEFKMAVKEWLNISDRQAEMRKQNSEFNKRKKQLNLTIIGFMKNNKKDICNLGENGILQLKEQKTSVALKKDYVEKLLRDFTNNEDMARQAAEYIFNNKETRTKDVIKKSNVVL